LTNVSCFIASLCFGISVYLFVISIAQTRQRWIYSQSLARESRKPHFNLSKTLTALLRNIGPSKMRDQDWDEMLFSLAYELKSGNSLEKSVSEVAKRSRGQPRMFLKAAETQYQSGVNMSQSLRRCAEGMRYAEDVASIVEIGTDTGANMPVLLLNLADSIRKNRMFQEEVKTKLTEARLTAIILALLPWLTIIAAVSIGSPSIETLFVDPRGKTLLQASCFGWLCGMVMIRFLIKRTMSYPT
jgi:Flp pilus assembly protein TadB